MWEMRKVSSSKQGILATQSREWNESQPNYLAKLYILSYSAPTVVTFQFLACFTRVPLWQLVNHESVARSNSETPLIAHILSFLHTISHTPLQKSHLNTGYLITKIQANLALNKANTWFSSFDYSMTKP